MAEDEMDTSVRVALRIRPQIPRELIDLCRVCTQVTPGEPQIIIGTDKAFTFDYVFDVTSVQSEIYGMCVERLVEGALKGYNATVLAYGQTGSGKTYTMGTGFDREIIENLEGIIPRAVRHIFAGIDEMQHCEANNVAIGGGDLQFSVAAQFMELYNEEIIDLLDPYNKSKIYKIHEDVSGGICVTGATIKPINGPTDALRCLQQGALARTTASTQMNAQSSRSHALFTILIRRQRVMSPEESGIAEGDLETLTSKFHFVDLAGSERLKRTGATGDRAREGISINCGLLSLGNVISALGDKSKKASHIPYRDSKLTRLLQDSLGGNSQTLMIACISPSDRDFMETLNTLKYANRARNIKNRIQINQDQSSRTISSLRREIAVLQLELLDYKQGKRSVDSDGNAAITDTFHENAMLLADNKRMQQRIKAMQETINSLTERNVELLTEKASHEWSSAGTDKTVTDLIGGYLKEIEKLQARLIESDQLYQQLKKSMNSPRNNISKNLNNLDDDPGNMIVIAKKEIEKEREILMSRSLPGYAENSTDPPNQNFENDSISDSDSESEDNDGEMQAELNDLSSDIELKTKLIEQLELSQQRMQIMRQHYEEKLNVLNSKIINTQRERDQVLANMGVGAAPNQPNDKIKKVRDEYERKLSDMQRELRKLQSAQKEHIRQQRELQAQDSQLRNLKNELYELKSAKIKLMRKMTEENNRHKEAESRKAREISQLRKEARKQLNTIKSLQAQGAAKDQVLKRRTEQVSALRKGQRGGLSVKAAGRVVSKKTEHAFSTRQARIKWESVLRTINRAARSKQAVVELERELERLLQERETLSKDLANVKRRQRTEQSQELASEEDTLAANLNYIQENITHVQHSIMEMEEGREQTSESQVLHNMVDEVRSIDEAKFLLEKLCSTAVLQSCDIALSQNRLLEREAILNEVQQDSSIQQQLLQHVLSQNPNLNLSESFLPANSTASTLMTATWTNPNPSSMQPLPYTLHREATFDLSTSELDNKPFLTRPHSAASSRSTSPAPLSHEHDNANSIKTPKVRRRTALPQDLLFGENSDKNDMTRSYIQPDANRSLIPLARVPSAPGSLKDEDPSSPKTPLAFRRMISREENSDVFSRLGAGTQDPTPGGRIRICSEKMKAGAPLQCTYVVEGHSSSVLTVQVNENKLYTGAADRTVRIWDLEKSSGPLSLIPHPGPVVSIVYDKKSNLLFSACGAFVRAWDSRDGYTRPVKTMSSSGTICSGAINPGLIQNGENPITALCVGATGNLYTAASDKVRIWDLRAYSCLGKLSGGHQAAVMCVTAWQGQNNTDFVATGSKDHYVKVFEVPSNGGLVLPLLHLEPPHYDGVQSLCVAQNALGADATLFSGSRDSGIKRWDLRNGELKQSLNNAHKGWVSGMAISDNVLLTTCRGGFIRLWNVDTCDSLADIKTDSPINNIVASGSLIYTGSSSGEVRIWRFTTPNAFSN